MRTAALVCLLLVATGCGRPTDHEPLTQFLVALEKPLKTDYEDKVRLFPQEQWGTRRVALRLRDHVVVIDEYLVGNPPLSEKGRVLVDSVRQICVEEAELFEMLIGENRFERTKAEEDRFNRLQREYQEKLLAIGRRIDGKD